VDERKITFIPYNMYIRHYGLLNSNQAREEENPMLEYRFLQGQFKIHDPLGLANNHTKIVSITWDYALERWD